MREVRIAMKHAKASHKCRPLCLDLVKLRQIIERLCICSLNGKGHQGGKFFVCGVSECRKALPQLNDVETQVWRQRKQRSVWTTSRSAWPLLASQMLRKFGRSCSQRSYEFGLAFARMLGSPWRLERLKALRQAKEGYTQLGC